jgi:hypothetical protein
MIDPAKKYRTRDGREVRIYAVDGGGLTPVQGAIRNDGHWYLTYWHEDGRWSEMGYELGNDLIEVRPRIQREVWVNVYPDSLIIFDDKQEADEYGPAYPNQSRIACVKLVIDCEEGHGLD